MNVILYTSGCSKCEILKKKLEEKNIQFIEEHDIKKMIKMGMVSAPNLSVDGVILDYSKAIIWINGVDNGR